MTYRLDHLSPSKLACYEYCPGEFRQRYVERITQPPDVPLSFGLAVHKGLEALYTGGDPDAAFRRDWRNRCDGLAALGVGIPPRLTHQGLHLIEQVQALGLQGMPERKVWLHKAPFCQVGLLGFVDLWDEAGDTVYDFKTTSAKWSQERAHRERWQPGFYSFAYWLEHGRVPHFEYVVMDRNAGTVQRFPTPRTEEQIVAILEEAAALVKRIDAQEFDCRCRDGRHDLQVAA